MNKLAIPVFIISIIFTVLVWDLGNPDALTQGTEGFYLQISKEMSQKNSWLTPYYHDKPHWSKPPIHFWLTMPLSILFKSHHLLINRLMMVLISILTIFLLSRWLYHHFKTNQLLTFFYFFSTLGFLKYSRIYMMEITLTSFNLLTIIYLYDYLKSSDNKKLILSSFFLACATLAKGPISLVMAAITLGLYFFFAKPKHKPYVVKCLKYLSLSFALSSIWFIACYLRYGQEFIDYFFIRENMGKFASKPYPISSLFNGILLYGFPWSFLIPAGFYFYYKKFKKQNLRSIEIFLISAFFGYYLIWFIPNQKSYHYVIPALPYLLILILVQLDHFKSSKKLIFFFHLIVLSFSTTLLFLMIIGAKIAFTDTSISISSSILSLILSLLSLFYFITTSTWYIKAISMFIFNSVVWIIFVPNFYLPLVPTKVVNFVQNKKISAFYRKPYFIKERIGQDVLILNIGQVKAELQKKTQHIFIRKEFYDLLKLQGQATIVKSWDKWIRGNPPKRILKAISNGDLSILKEKMYLIR